MRQAQIFCNNIFAGVLTETDSGKYIFRYDESFLFDEKQTAISLSFPKSQREFTSTELFPFFYNINNITTCNVSRINLIVLLNFVPRPRPL